MKATLGLKLNPWHDTGAALIVDDGGAPLRVVSISQERLDRVKNSRAFPADAIAYCLDAAGIKLEDVDLVVSDFIVTPGLNDGFDTSDRSQSGEKEAFFRKLANLGIRVLFAEHHLCHAASAYFATEWTEATALVIDGHGSNYETQTIFTCSGNGITKLATSRRPGIGWMYTAVTEQLLGFQHLQEGKTMGLAGWAKDGGIWTEQFRSRSEPHSEHETIYEQFVEEGAQWKLSTPPNLVRRGPKDDPVAAPFAQYAFAAQSVLEADVMQVVRTAAQVAPSKRLCYSGGVALNIPANRLILDSGLFEDVFIQPAASDAGIPLGAALFGHYSVLGGERRWKMKHAFLGRDYKTTEISASVAKWEGHYTSYAVKDVARVLANDYLVAWCQGGSEHGPRALGHRSILCLPRHPQMKAYLNREVKHREMFRPFAPLVPMEEQANYFDLEVASPFMLINATVHADKAPLIPAVVHADQTARVQSVEASEQPELHALLLEIGRCTGVPVLLNTSLNLAGEPIVESPADVVDLFQRSRLDALVIGTCLLTKRPLSELLARKNPGPDQMAEELARDAGKTAVKTTPQEPEFGLAASVPFSDEMIDLWLDEHLTVCGVGKTLVAGPGATAIVAKLLSRGIDAWGVDTFVGAARSTSGGRCNAGSLAKIPVEHGPFESAVLMGALDGLSEAAAAKAQSMLARAVSGAVHVRLCPTQNEAEEKSIWSRRFLASGFRKHPLRAAPVLEGDNGCTGSGALYFERLTAAGETFDAGDVNTLGAADPSRGASSEADAICARYELAARFIRPWDSVLDIASGCGSGVHLMRSASRAARFIAVDADPKSTEYARSHFAAPTIEFRCADPADALLDLPEASIDFAICTVALDDAGAFDGLLTSLNSVLAPGGRVLVVLSGTALDAEGDDLKARITDGFLLEAVYEQRAETDERGDASGVVLKLAAASDDLGVAADARVLVLMRDPLTRPLPDYRETAFGHLAEGAHAEVTRYAEFYSNPWILHSLVHGGFRMTSQPVLAETLGRLLKNSPAESADAGAALCILIYRVIAGVVPAAEGEELVRRAERYLSIASPNAHQLRWQVSLAFSLGQLALHRGELAKARERFATVAAFDVFKWGPSLATKKSEALFLAGWLAWCAHDTAAARHFWKQGLQFGRELLACSLDESLLNPDFPNLFCAGDGTRELVYALENVGRCGHGLHAIEAQARGVTCGWREIFNSFRWQLDHTSAKLRAFASQSADRPATGRPAAPKVKVAGGFHPPEDHFRWMTKNGTLEINAREPMTLAFQLECSEAAYYANWPLEVNVSVDGRVQHRETFSQPRERKTIRLNLDARARRVTLEASDAFVPADKRAGDDRRQLSVRISRLRLERTAAASRDGDASLSRVVPPEPVMHGTVG